MNHTDEYYMKRALHLAGRAQAMDEVPVGAVVVWNGTIIGRGWNRRQTRQNPLEHAELMAIAQAARKLKSWRLEGCTLYVTLEPCPMCAGAIVQSRLERVVYGARDPKGGAVDSVMSMFEIPSWNHHPIWQGGLLEEECSSLLRTFFKEKRRQKKQEKAARRAAEDSASQETKGGAF